MVLLLISIVFLRPQIEPKKFIQHYKISPEATHKVFALKIKVIKYVCSKENDNKNYAYRCNK